MQPSVVLVSATKGRGLCPSVGGWETPEPSRKTKKQGNQREEKKKKKEEDIE